MGIPAIERSGIIRNFNQLRTRLVDVLFQLKQKISAGNPNHLDARMISQIERLLPLLRDMNAGKLTVQQKTELKKFAFLLKEYREARGSNMSPLESSLVNEAEKGIKDLLEKEAKIEQRDRTRETQPAPINNSPVSSQNHENSVREQILNGQNSTNVTPGLNTPPTTNPNAPIESFRFEHKLHLGELFNPEFRQGQSMETLLRSLAGESRFERSSTVSELFGKILFSFVFEKLLKEITRRGERSGELTREEIERAVKQLNAELSLSEIKVKTKSEPEMKKEKFSYQIEYDSKENVIRIEIAGDLKKAETARTAAELLRSDPKGTLPLMVEAAIRLISGGSDARPEVLRFISETVSQVFTATSPAPSAGATNVQEIVRMLVHDIKTDNQNQLPVKAEVVQTVLAALPNAALPAILKENSSHPSFDENMVLDLARTSEGEKYVISAFTQDSGQKLVSSEIGQKITVAVARDFIERAKTEVKANAQLPVKDKAQQLLVITNMVASANPGRFEAGKMSLENARTLLELVAKIDRCFDPIALKNISRARKTAEKNRSFTSYSRKTRSTSARRIAQKALRQGNVAGRVKAVNEALRAASVNNLVIPKKILENIVAGLAGVNPMMLKADAPGAFALPQESGAFRYLKNLVAQLEAQLQVQGTQAAQRVAAGRSDAGTPQRVLNIAIQAFLYGTIMRLVKGRVAKVDEIMNILKSRKHLEMIVKYLEEKNEKEDLATRIEVVTAYLADTITELDSTRALAAAA